MARQPTPRPRLRLGQFRAKDVDTMHECFANPERNDGFGADSSPSRDDPCRRALRPMEASKAAIRVALRRDLPSAVRKYRPFAGGLANASYPTLCGLSRSVLVREESAKTGCSPLASSIRRGWEGQRPGSLSVHGVDGRN